MKFTEKPKWKTIIFAICCLFAVAALAGGSYAAYSRQAYQRGVARNRDSETVRFTSNYLQTCISGTDAKNYAGRTILFSEDQKKATTESTVNISLFIYNYANENTNLVSQKDITYDLKITFAGGVEGSNYTVASKNGGTAVGLTEEKGYEIKGMTLIGRSAASHEYTITIPAADIDHVKITVTAIPTNLSVTNNQILAAVLAPCTASTTKPFTVEGKFIYDSKNDTTTTGYDGFNYEISISSGTATGTLTWNPNAVEIDPYFLQKVGKQAEDIVITEGTEATSPSASLTITMNQADGTGDYLIPFYIKDREEIPSSWSDMEKIISFSATQTS